MKKLGIFLLVLGSGFTARAGILAQTSQSQQAKPGEKQPAASAASQTPETQVIVAPAPPGTPATRSSAEAGYLDSGQVKELLEKVGLLEYRINDLLTTARPERWKISEASRNSFNQTLEALRAALRALEGWRGLFEKRTDSMYLCYETHAALQAVLPRLEGIARSISQHENPSLGAQYSQAGKQLFDLQQTLGVYFRFLLRNHNQILSALEANLANCQTTLGYAMRPSVQAATPMRNAPAVRPERRRSPGPTGSAAPATSGARPIKKPELKQAAPKTPAAPAKTREKKR